MSYILYAILAILALLVALLAIAVVRTLLMPSKTSDYQPKADPRAAEHAQKLSKMIQYETVSRPDDLQREKFLGFHKVLEELFPLVHQHLEKTELEGSLLFYWKGEQHDKPIVLMSHQDVVPAEGVREVSCPSGITSGVYLS